MSTDTQTPNRLYFAVWRWHFYAGLYTMRLGAPPRPEDVRYAKGAILIMLALSLALPMLGLTLLFVIALALVILSAIPPLKHLVS